MNFYFLPNAGSLRHAVCSWLGDDIMDCESFDDRTAIADYISDLTAELAVLAAWAEHTDLARMLEMARLESEQICGRTRNVAEGPVPGDMAGDLAGNAVQDADTGSFESTNVVRLSALRAAQR